MQVLLLKNIPKLGSAGEVKNVNDGYARNYLFPTKLAEPITGGKIVQLGISKTAQAKKIAQVKLKAISALGKINNQKITIKAKASPKGTLFKAISATDIATAVLEQLGQTLKPEQIVLQHHLKEVGLSKVALKFHNEQANLTIEILQNNEQEK
ncbi:MAG: 50S ribosomal protein L9 [Patescibacteria group bacterium]|jgi:large subunit ribosomal protein L9